MAGVAEQSLDDITRKFWAYSGFITSVPDRDMPALLATAAEQVARRWQELHPEATMADVLASFRRTRPAEKGWEWLG